MRGLPRGASIEIPDGWNAAAFFGRIVTAGLCRYAELKSSELSAKDVFNMHRILDFQEYCRAKAVDMAKTEKPRRFLFDDERLEKDPWA